MTNGHNYAAIPANAANIDLEGGNNLPIQPLAAPRVQNAADNLINTKKANLRGYFDSMYSCDNANKETRIEDIVSLLRDIDRTIERAPDQNPPEDGSPLYNLFRGRDSTRLAEGHPRGALNTNEVLDYYTQYIPDILYKAVHGRYPEGRGAAVHGQADDAPIVPLTRQELQEVYRQLGKDINEPLLEFDKLRILKDAATPTLCERIGEEARNIHNKSKDISKYGNLALLAGGLGILTNLSYGGATGSFGDTTYAQANGYTGAFFLGVYAPILGVFALGYTCNVVTNTALSLTGNLPRDIAIPQQDAVPPRAVMFNELVETVQAVEPAIQADNNANISPRPPGVNVGVSSSQSENRFGITPRESFAKNIQNLKSGKYDRSFGG